MRRRTARPVRRPSPARSTSTCSPKTRSTTTASFGRHELDVLAGYTAESTRVQNVALTGTGFPDGQHSHAQRRHDLRTGLRKQRKRPEPVRSATRTRCSESYWDVSPTATTVVICCRPRCVWTVRRSSPRQPQRLVPSVSVGWRISEEQFMKEQRVFSNLAPRFVRRDGNNSIDYVAALEVLNPANYPTGSGNGTLIPGRQHLVDARKLQYHLGADRRMELRSRCRIPRQPNRPDLRRILLRDPRPALRAAHAVVHRFPVLLEQHRKGPQRRC